MRRVLIVLGALFGAVVVLIGAGTYLFAYQLTRYEAYPAFMEKDLPKGRVSYDELKRAFSQFAEKAFPVGSDAKGAIAQAIEAGFQMAPPDRPNSAELLWSRHAGPCNERYFITIDQTADGKVASVTGKLFPVCL
ncbi:hypothetical protein [Bradyrhizobium sp. CER78]|uniref:hypothetical protein n=1 Tax=Bradyrhizobium sp. CER78 TaxID=3039162 RepID=UPI0024474B5D|nr:hypothetical protein [Bradyrhizobium sp. CER78]MDH2386773.1 hypothetical protein [Bradyrhizobium sp. CER78]